MLLSQFVPKKALLISDRSVADKGKLSAWSAMAISRAQHRAAYCKLARPSAPNPSNNTRFVLQSSKVFTSAISPGLVIEHRAERIQVTDQGSDSDSIGATIQVEVWPKQSRLSL
jgi:hypothetical protein